MKNKGFTLVELLAVIAILAILVIVAMPNVLGMFNQAKVNSFVTEVQKIMDTATTTFTRDALLNSGKTVYYSSESNATLNTKELDMSGNKKNYFLEMDRNGEFKRVVVYDSNYCYDIYSSGSKGKYNSTKSKLINDKIDKTTVVVEDVLESGNDSVSITIDGDSYIVKGCDATISNNIVIPPAVVQDGAIYTGADGTVYYPGDDMPEHPSIGDKYTLGDYEYYYNKRRPLVGTGVNASAFNNWVTDETMNGWGVKVISGTKEYYGEIETYINNKPVVSLNYLFSDSAVGVIMKKAPKIPKTTTELVYAFANLVINLKEAPSIPYGVEDITGIFYGTEIEILPGGFVIPGTVKYMDYAFYRNRFAISPDIPESVISMTFAYALSYLEKAPYIPSGVLSMEGVFEQCSKLVKGPNLSHLTKAENFYNTFNQCTSLVDASNIVLPASAANLQYTFSDCTNLVNPPDLSLVSGGQSGQVIVMNTFSNCTNMTGTITINTPLSGFASSIFQGTTKPITLKGTSSSLDSIASKFSNVTVSR